MIFGKKRHQEARIMLAEELKKEAQTEENQETKKNVELNDTNLEDVAGGLKAPQPIYTAPLVVQKKN